VDDLRLGTDPASLARVDIDGILGRLPIAHHRWDKHELDAQRSPAARALPMATAAQEQARQVPIESRKFTRASPEQSLAHGPALGGGRCGDRMQFTITTIDPDGTVMGCGGSRVAVTVSGVSLVSKAYPEPRPWVDDRKDGTYTVQFVCATPGKYEVTAYIDGIPLPMCPITINVSAGPAAASHCDVGGLGARQCDEGGRAEFWIQARDEFGNNCSSGGARFSVRSIGPAKLHEVADNEDGTYAVVYSVPVSAKGDIRLEVCLDGISVKGSPVVPKLRQRVAPEVKNDPSNCLAQDGTGELNRLRWLKQNPLAELPELPPPPGANAIDGFSDGSAQAAARLQWRATDEWRQLVDLRTELAKSREGLARYQAVLLRVAESVHREYTQLEESRRKLECDRQDINEVEARLDWMRGDFTRQYKQQQRWAVSGLTGESVGAGICDSTPVPSGGAENANVPLVGDDVPGGELAQLAQLQAHVWGQQTRLQDLEANLERTTPRQQPETHTPQTQPSGGSGSPRVGRPELSPLPPPPPPPLVPPLAGQPSWEQTSDAPWRALPIGQEAPPPPPMAPPALDDPDYGQLSSGPLVLGGQVSAGIRPGASVLRTPPPPPAPPPPVVLGAGISSGGYGVGGGGVTKPIGRIASTGASPEELGTAMRKLFQAFASRATASAPAARGGRAGRVALGLPDFVRLANAAQLRLPRSDLTSAFHTTIAQYQGGQPSEDSEEDRSLPFELFVELLVETARKKYSPYLSDTESTTALFEEHLLPVSRRLRELENLPDGAG